MIGKISRIQYYVFGILFLSIIMMPESPSRGQPGSGSTHIFTEDGAWCWFQDPRAIYIKGQLERTYAQWVTKEGQLQIGAYNHKNGQIELFTLKKNWDVDDHNVGAFLELEDKRIMVFYARHNKQGIYCSVSSKPEDISSWEKEITISNSNRITYAHPVYLSDEQTYYLFWRGSSWKPTYSTSKDGKNWEKEAVLLQDISKEASNVRPYTKITSDGKSSIHFTFTDGHPRVEPQNSVYYMKYLKGKFYKADDTIIGSITSLPIRHTKSDIVYNGKVNNVRAWVWDIALDKHGNPVIAYTQLPEAIDHRYHFAHWTGSAWEDTELTTGGKWFPQTPEGVDEREQHYSGGISLNHSNPFVLYLSRPINGIFEIEKWTSKDKGVTWHAQPITANSMLPNVRPVVPRGYKKKKDFVLWMNGSYEHYTKYNTAIRLIDFKN